MQSDGNVPTFEDKVAQRAVTMLLEAVYEQDFLPCSYGFRPGRSAHQALRTLQNALRPKRLYWVIDIDIRKYFRTISQKLGAWRRVREARRELSQMSDRELSDIGISRCDIESIARESVAA